MMLSSGVDAEGGRDDFANMVRVRGVLKERQRRPRSDKGKKRLNFKGKESTSNEDASTQETTAAENGFEGHMDNSFDNGRDVGFNIISAPIIVCCVYVGSENEVMSDQKMGADADDVLDQDASTAIPAHEKEADGHVQDFSNMIRVRGVLKERQRRPRSDRGKKRTSFKGRNQKHDESGQDMALCEEDAERIIFDLQDRDEQRREGAPFAESFTGPWRETDAVSDRKRDHEDVDYCDDNNHGMCAFTYEARLVDSLFFVDSAGHDNGAESDDSNPQKRGRLSLAAGKDGDS
jgi:hypothetical protein